MPLTKEEKIELLKKAREAKANKRAAALQLKEEIKQQQEMEYVQQVEKGQYKDNFEDLEEIIKPKKSKAKKQKEQQETKTLELTLPERENREINETIRVKAPTKKKIIKRVVEVEESDTEEEVIEEVVRIPRKANEVKISRKAMLDKLAEQNRMKLMNELFP